MKTALYYLVILDHGYKNYVIPFFVLKVPLKRNCGTLLLAHFIVSNVPKMVVNFISVKS